MRARRGLSARRTDAAMRLPSGDHDGAVKNRGARTSGMETVARTVAFEPSTSATIRALCDGSGCRARNHAMRAPSGEKVGRESMPETILRG